MAEVDEDEAERLEYASREAFSETFSVDYCAHLQSTLAMRDVTELLWMAWQHGATWALGQAASCGAKGQVAPQGTTGGESNVPSQGKVIG